MSLPVKFVGDAQRPAGSLLLTALEGAAEIVALTVARTSQERRAIVGGLLESGVARSVESPALNALTHVVSAINSGKALTNQREIASLVHSQEQRAQVVDQLLQTHEYERVLALTSAKWVLERELIQAALTGQLTVAEKLAILPMLNSAEAESRKRVKSATVDIKDVMALLEKVEFASQADHADLVARFANTSPQGRELVRKVASTLSKAARAHSATVEDV